MCLLLTRRAVVQSINIDNTNATSYHISDIIDSLRHFLFCFCGYCLAIRLTSGSGIVVYHMGVLLSGCCVFCDGGLKILCGVDWGGRLFCE